MRLVLPLALIPVLYATPGYRVEADLEYSRPDGVSLKLDAHLPEGDGPFGAIILAHGGGWMGGFKTADFVQTLFPVLDRTGMAWFTIDYRKGPRHKYPSAVDDVEAAVTWVKENAARFRVDPNRIALVGESAGGHLVSLAGSRNRAGVAAVVCLYGPVDLVLFAKRHEAQAPKGGLRDFFGIEEWGEGATAKLREASPSTWINAKTPPFLVIHGTKDPSVPYEQALLLVKLFRERGIPVNLFTVEDGVHGAMNWEKDPKFHGYKAVMTDWLVRALKPR